MTSNMVNYLIKFFFDESLLNVVCKNSKHFKIFLGDLYVKIVTCLFYFTDNILPRVKSSDLNAYFLGREDFFKTLACPILMNNKTHGNK